jgi:hypothetical protein
MDPTINKFQALMNNKVTSPRNDYSSTIIK